MQFDSRTTSTKDKQHDQPARPMTNRCTDCNAIKTHHMKQVETLVTRLKAIPEGNGTMFDNTTIIYMPETGAGGNSRCG